MLLPDIQEAKCFEFKVQILPRPGGPWGAKKNFVLRAHFAPLDLFQYTPLFRTKFLNGG